MQHCCTLNCVNVSISFPIFFSNIVPCFYLNFLVGWKCVVCDITTAVMRRQLIIWSLILVLSIFCLISYLLSGLSFPSHSWEAWCTMDHNHLAPVTYRETVGTISKVIRHSLNYWMRCTPVQLRSDVQYSDRSLPSVARNCRRSAHPLHSWLTLPRPILVTNRKGRDIEIQHKFKHTFLFDLWMLCSLAKVGLW